MFDYVIVGAGFAGSVLAERLAREKNAKILLVEARRTIGGNCYDYTDENGIIVHKYGPHLFHTDDEGVWEYLSRFTSWIAYQHHVKACIDGKKVPIPFNLNTLHEVFPHSMAVRIEDKLLERFAYNTKVPILELKKAEDKDLQYLADYVYDKIFLHYTEKQWGMRPEEIDGAVTARVPVLVGRDDRYFTDRFQGVPRDGYARIFETMLDHPNIKLMLNTSAKEILSLRNEKTYLFGQEYGGIILYTGMVDELFDFIYGELPYRSVRMSFESMPQERYQEAPTVNYPNNYQFTRITEFKQIHPHTGDCTTILKEYPQPYRRGENTAYYPIFTPENQSMYRKYAERAKRYENLYLIGRLAEYRYYDMDDVIKQALLVYSRHFA